MIYISFVEMLPHAIENIGELNAVLFLFFGFILMFLIDALIPEQKNPHHFDKINFEVECETKEASEKVHEDMRLKRTGILAALAIGIHNFPEGIATFAATLENPEWGFMIAIAVAIHNIPEGVSVALPIQYATKNRKQAFLYSFFSGIAEPIGAFLAFLILMPILTPAILSGIMAAIAGIMIYISVDEIIPVAHSYNEGHWAIVGFLIGMVIMAVTLLML
jgi:ZIP family zinc transporter